MMDGNPVKVFKATYKHADTSNLKPGSILTDSKTHFDIACKDGFIQLLEIQPASKKRMDIASFLRGYQLPAMVDPA